MHSVFSDGTDGPEELVRSVVKAGITVFALTDHDTAAGAEAVRKLVPEGVVFIPGVEFSCRASSGKCHILGYGCDADAPEFKRVLALGRALRSRNLESRLTFLREQGILFPEEELARLRAMESAGKPHLGNLMVRYGYAASKDEAIAGVLNRLPFASERVSAEAAVRAILSSGGIPVWAHPFGGEGEPAAGPERFEATLSELVGYGLRGLECFYSRYTAEQSDVLTDRAEKLGLCVSGGSDYHGRNKDIPLGVLNADGAEIDPERITLLSAGNW